MKKTKLLAALAVAAVLAVGGGVLAGCKPTGGDDSGKGHTHNYTQWTKVDENTHRGTCDAKGDCDAKTKTESHVYDDDNDTTCNKCDHVREVAKVYTVTLAKGEGTLAEGTETTLTTVDGKLATLPAVTAPAGKWFKGWYTDETEGEKVDADYVFSGETTTVTIYAQYVAEVTVTLVKGEGTLAEGTETTLTTVNGKVTLPGATASTENWHFVGWYDAEEGGNEVNATTVLLEGRTLYARYVRDNGIWVGNQLAKSLVTNTGADHVQYWFGQDERVELEKDSEVSIYMGGKLISFWISGSCVDTSKASTEKIPSATVTRDASFVIYLNDYSSESNPDNWTCEFIGTAASYDTTDELPTGCKGIEVKTIDDKTITLYFVNPAGEAINGDNAHKYQLYAWDGVAVEGSTSTEPFKGWTANPTLNTAITASCGIVKTTSWKLHWDGGESSAFSSLEADKAYVIKLKIKDGGDCEVCEYVGEADILTPYDAPEEDEREFVQGGYYLVGNGGFTTANFALDKKCYIDPTAGLEVPLTTTDSYKIVVCDYNANYEDGKHIDWSFNPKYEMAAGKEDGFLNLPGSSNGSVKVGGKYTITIVGEGEDMKFVFTPDESLVPNLSTVDNNDYYIRGLGDNWDDVTTQPKLTKAEDKNEFTIKCPLEVGDTFKIADASWNVQFGFSAIQDSANVADYFENDYGNIKCLVAGNYTFTITTDINNAANNTITWEYKALTPTEPEEAE